MPSTDDAVGAGLMEFLSDFRSPQGNMAHPREPSAAPAEAATTAAPRPPAPPVGRAANFAPARPRSEMAARHPKAPRPPLTFDSAIETVLNPTENGLATAALCSGLGSMLVPLLAVAGIVLGAASLYRTRERPWLHGEIRAFGGIITSLVLGSVSLTIWMQLLGN